jgi:hypothetical protein
MQISLFNQGFAVPLLKPTHEPIGTDPDRRVDTHALAPSPESYKRLVLPSRKAYCWDNNTAQSSYRSRLL